MQRLRILGLVAMLALVAALAAPTLAASPGSRQATIQLTFDVGGAGETFVGSGPGVCASGTTDNLDIWFFEYDDAFSIRMTKRLICDDGSGTFTIFLSAGEPAGSQLRSGGWAIMEGTGVYERAVGGGTLTAKTRYPKDLAGVDTMTGTITH
jgi:hypothetical protein